MSQIGRAFKEQGLSPKGKRLDRNTGEEREDRVPTSLKKQNKNHPVGGGWDILKKKPNLVKRKE